jgi:hypothetical protein
VQAMASKANITGIFKVHSHYGEIHLKLVGFKEYRNILIFLETTNLAQFLPKCKHTFGLVHTLASSHLATAISTENFLSFQTANANDSNNV